MSYDVEAGPDTHNYTYNMSRFFADFRVHPRDDMEGKHRSEVASLIDSALILIRDESMEELRAKYDAPNGWGSVPTAIQFLEDVRDSCRKEIPDVVRVY